LVISSVSKFYDWDYFLGAWLFAISSSGLVTTLKNGVFPRVVELLRSKTSRKALKTPEGLLITGAGGFFRVQLLHGFLGAKLPSLAAGPTPLCQYKAFFHYFMK
jgi:hypothetical protein